jgi:glutathione synthase/RimK-type ligase-like ATP-grasp enzyme
MPDHPQIALVTWRNLPELTADDRLLLPELRARGATPRAVVWDDPAVAWESFDAIVVRSCWDYHLRIGEFSAWLAQLEAIGARLVNPPAMLRWNLDKRYLRDLDLPIVPTVWLEPRERVELEPLLRARGWKRAVVKPAISASAFGTFVTDGRDQARVDELLAHSPLLVQPFIDEVVTLGEWSLIYFDGVFSHAVVKRPREGDFRVQSELGATTTLAPAPRGLREQADTALAAAPALPTYARVDGVMIDGVFTLMELELIEPVLFLGMKDGSAARFAEAVVGRMKAEG